MRVAHFSALVCSRIALASTRKRLFWSNAVSITITQNTLMSTTCRLKHTPAWPPPTSIWVVLWTQRGTGRRLCASSSYVAEKRTRPSHTTRGQTGASACCNLVAKKRAWESLSKAFKRIKRGRMRSCLAPCWKRNARQWEKNQQLWWPPPQFQEQHASSPMHHVKTMRCLRWSLSHPVDAGNWNDFVSGTDVHGNMIIQCRIFM